jgi:hypothetical protein
MSKRIHITTGPDGESHIKEMPFDFTEGGSRTDPQKSGSVQFVLRPEGSFIDFHPAPRKQYVLYLTASVEIGLGDGSTITMEPGDALLAEDITGHGHTSRIKKPGLCAFVTLED